MQTLRNQKWPSYMFIINRQTAGQNKIINNKSSVKCSEFIYFGMTETNENCSKELTFSLNRLLILSCISVSFVSASAMGKLKF
jgi:hypothetical protein